jgi:hypothetical protein
MSDELEVTQGPSWTSVRYFSTFDEAEQMRKSLKTSDLTGTLQVKIKRCGVAGVIYVVKTRQTAEMTAATQSVEQDLNSKPQKKERKTKNRG